MSQCPKITLQIYTKQINFPRNSSVRVILGPRGTPDILSLIRNWFSWLAYWCASLNIDSRPDKHIPKLDALSRLPLKHLDQRFAVSYQNLNISFITEWYNLYGNPKTGKTPCSQTPRCFWYFTAKGLPNNQQQQHKLYLHHYIYVVTVLQKLYHKKTNKQTNKS